jgi:hypothetical protein
VRQRLRRQENALAHWLTHRVFCVWLRATQAGEFEIHPWIHNPSNALSLADVLRPVVIPDVSPTEILGLDKGNQPDFSMCAGEFLEAYAQDKGPYLQGDAWPYSLAVVT